MTAKSVKQINKNKVYAEIYRGRSVSKLQIVQKLQMGLSTVDQNLKALEEEGLIEKKAILNRPGAERHRQSKYAGRRGFQLGLVF